MLMPELPDFKNTKNDEAPKDNVDGMQQEDVLNWLVWANTRDLTRCEKRSYDLLIKLEKEIQWEQLLKWKTDAFIAE